MTKKSYKTTAEHFTLTLGKNRVAIPRPLNKKIDKLDKKELDEAMGKVVELRGSEDGHRINKED